jgi:hypothetical protein
MEGMFVRFLKWVQCPDYHTAGEIVEMSDGRALQLMREMPGAIEEYDPRTAADSLVDSDRPAVMKRMATGLKKA